MILKETPHNIFWYLYGQLLSLQAAVLQYCLLETQTFTLVLLHPTSRRGGQESLECNSTGAQSMGWWIWRGDLGTLSISDSGCRSGSTSDDVIPTHFVLMSSADSLTKQIIYVLYLSSSRKFSKCLYQIWRLLHTCYCNIVTFLSCLSTYSQS